MKAVVFHDVGDVRLDDVDEPKLAEPTDAIVRITASAICGTDLHMVRGTMSGMKAGTILGHEGVGIVEEVGPAVRNLVAGDRVVICSTIACGACSYCRAGYQSQCDNANPNGPAAGTAFFGGPEQSGPLRGLQAERVNVPFAHVTCVKLPDERIQLTSSGDTFPQATRHCGYLAVPAGGPDRAQPVVIVTDPRFPRARGARVAVNVDVNRADSYPARLPRTGSA